MASSAGEKGGVFASLSSSSSWATISMSPVAMFGFSRPASRARTRPLTATTYSERAASALACAAGDDLFVEDDLGDAGAVAHVEEDEVAVVAAAVDPAHQDYVLAVLFDAEFAAHVRALQSA